MLATYEDPSVFAAAPDVDNTSLIDLLAVKGVTASCVLMRWLHLDKLLKTELIFIEAPDEHRAIVGQHVLWQCLKVREGRRKGARAWQDHFIGHIVVARLPRIFQTESEVPDNIKLE